MFSFLLLLFGLEFQEPTTATVEQAVAAIEELQESKAGDYEISQALIAVARLEVPEAATALYELVDTLSGQLHSIAIIALGNCKTDNRFALLGKIISKSKKQPDRISAAGVMVKSAEGREWLSKNYKKLKDAPVKAMLIGSLDGSSPAHEKLLLKALKEKNPTIKARALMVCANLRLEKAHKVALKSLGDSSMEVRRSAALACGIFGGTKSFTALIKEAEDARGPALRSAFRRALKSAQSADDIALIAKAMLKVRKVEARGLFAQSLIVSGVHQPDIAGPAFAKMLEEEDAGLRLLALRGIEATRNELALELIIELLDHEDFVIRSDAVRALGSFRNVPLIHAEKIASLSHDPNRAVRIGATLALTAVPVDIALAALEARLADEDWAVRDAAVEILASMQNVSAVRLLSEHMQRAVGMVRDETYQRLKALTGQDFGPMPRAWLNWVQDQPNDYQLPSPEQAQQMLADLKEKRSINSAGYGAVEYHGLAVRPGGVLFILDISGSMGFNYTQDGQLFHNYFTDELIRTIEGLGSDHQFDIVVFSGSAQSWNKGLLDASEANKKRAIQFVQDLRPWGGTNLAGALEFPFQLDEIQQVYLMTDGDPTVGTTLKSAIVDRVVELNRTRRIRINTIVAGDVDGNFLAELAALNGGESVDLRKGFEEEYEDDDHEKDADAEADEGN